MRVYAMCFLLLFMGMSIAFAGQVKYFPDGVLSADERSDQFRSEWYSKQLHALNEPSLWELSNSKDEGRESYRLLWLRTFHHPVAVRVDIGANGVGRLFLKMASGAGGYAPGELMRDETVTLEKVETDQLLTMFKKNGFWTLASLDESKIGADGAQWVIEGAKGGRYHIVDRWSPTDGAVRVIGLSLIKDFAKLKIPTKEIY
jgi:hypothetical protein